MQAVLYHSGVISHIVRAIMQDTTQLGLNFHQEVIDNEQSHSNYVNNGDNGISECNS
jgi:hypothetical protein